MRHDPVGESKESGEMLDGTEATTEAHTAVTQPAMPPLSRKRPHGKRAMKTWRSIGTCAAVVACASLSGCGSSAATVTYEVRGNIFYGYAAVYGTPGHMETMKQAGDVTQPLPQDATNASITVENGVGTYGQCSILVNGTIVSSETADPTAQSVTCRAIKLSSGWVQG